MASTHPYTCNSCQIAFRNSDLQRAHMRSEWHRYNLKRRITSLPPVSSDVFNEKVLQAQANTTAAATKAAFEKTCAACERTYSSENAFRNHLGSQRHKTKVALIKNNEVENLSVISSTFSLGESVNYVGSVDPKDDEEDYSLNEAVELINIGDHMISSRRSLQIQEGVPLIDDRAKISASPPSLDQVNDEVIDLNRCLFCNLESQSLDHNVTHMQKLHGMFVPERQYLVDLKGLINYFYEKIYYKHQCLYCGKLKQSIFGLQTHMRDKGHCKIPFFTEEEQLEIGEYYDFTSTYSDIETIDIKNSIQRSKHKFMETDEGWETDSSESSVDSTRLKSISSNRAAIGSQLIEKKASKTHLNLDQTVDPDDRDHDFESENENGYTGFISDFELHLPSGRIAGHRSMNKYFKQNLHHYPSLAEREENLLAKALAGPDNEDRGRVINVRHDRLNSRLSTNLFSRELGLLGVTEEKRKEVTALEKRFRKVEERGRRRSEWTINKQNNSQKHFRDPLLQ